MKLKSLINAINKTGLEIETNGRSYYVKGPKNSLEFYIQEDKVVSLYASPNNDKDDLYTDYYCGFFPKTIKRAIEYLIEN